MTVNWRRGAAFGILAWVLLTSGCALPADIRASTEHSAPSFAATIGDETPATTPTPSTTDVQAVEQGGDNESFAGPLARGFRILCDDQVNFYTLPHAAELGAGLAIAGVMANSTPDRKIASWYQESIRSRGSDDVSSALKNFGEYSYTLPAMAAVAVAGKLTEETAIGAAGFEWGTRSLRAVLVGAPVLGILQAGL